MHEVVIVQALRTPIGKHGGALAGVRPDDLAALVVGEVVKRAGVDPALVEEVYLGCANQAGEDNRDVARMALLLAGFPQSVAGVTFNRLCSSGLAAVNAAARAIACGEGQVFIAGGVESMSRSPWVMPKAERAFPTGHVTAYDTTLGWRLVNPRLEAEFNCPPEGLGETAENIYAEHPEITREMQDLFAFESQRKAVEAIKTGRFKEEIVPVVIPQRKGNPIVVDTDEHPRYKKAADGTIALDTSMEQLTKLGAAFRKGGTVTAGNASGINDGAAAILMMSADKAKELGLQPMARWVASAAAGVNPRTMGYGPIPATRKVLARTGLKIEGIDLFEVNEAFAVQALACARELGIPPEKLNVNGGAIALGHPLGCSGARLVVTLVHEMLKRGSHYGLATLCVGVGQGEATVLERM